MDPLRSDMRPAEALGGIERDARIEQLLLAGLDEYFAHRYEQAINLWTRVLFLDRQHDRARAYIERARRAQAERQRESDAALHQAVDAFHAGDVARARELVTTAQDRGASADDVQGVLERIERLGRTKLPGPQASRAPRFHGSRNAAAAEFGAAFQTASPDDTAAGSRHGWSAALLLVAAAIGVLLVGIWGLAVPEPSAWTLFSGPSSPATNAQTWTPAPLPIPHASERHLARAQSLYAAGRLRDALAFLDRIPVGDPLRPDADRLRANVQRQLLSLTTLERPPE